MRGTPVGRQFASGSSFDSRASRIFFASGSSRCSDFDGEIAAQQFKDRNEWNVLAVRRAMGFEDRQPGAPAMLDKFEAQAALTEPGLTHYADHLAVPQLRSIQCRLE